MIRELTPNFQDTFTQKSLKIKEIFANHDLIREYVGCNSRIFMTDFANHSLILEVLLLNFEVFL